MGGSQGKPSGVTGNAGRERRNEKLHQELFPNGIPAPHLHATHPSIPRITGKSSVLPPGALSMPPTPAAPRFSGKHSWDEQSPAPLSGFHSVHVQFQGFMAPPWSLPDALGARLSREMEPLWTPAGKWDINEPSLAQLHMFSAFSRDPGFLW